MDPIFKSIFGKQWNTLPKVMHKHYANKPYCDDHYQVKGNIDVMCKWYFKPLLRLVNITPSYNEINVPITVNFTSNKNNNNFYFERIFYFNKKKKVFSFNSYISQVKDNEVIEYMKYGICWNHYYNYNGTKISLKHKGYILKIRNIKIPLPISWLIGKIYANETPINDDSFNMDTQIIHPILGVIYEYKGKFKFSN